MNKLLQYFGYISPSDESIMATFPADDFDKSSIKLESTIFENKQYNMCIDRLYFWGKYTIISVIFKGLVDGAYYSNYKYDVALIDKNGMKHNCLFIYLLSYSGIRKTCDSSNLCWLRLLEKENKSIMLFFPLLSKELLITGRIHFEGKANIDFKIPE